MEWGASPGPLEEQEHEKVSGAHEHGLGHVQHRQRRSGALSSYADANGFIDVQTLTCGQLANTYQEDANALTAWYSGWYNGLAHRHYADFKKGRVVEHQVIEFCKAHPDEKIIHAIATIIKEDRAEGLMNEK